MNCFAMIMHGCVSTFVLPYEKEQFNHVQSQMDGNDVLWAVQERFTQGVEKERLNDE